MLLYESSEYCGICQSGESGRIASLLECCDAEVYEEVCEPVKNCMNIHSDMINPALQRVNSGLLDKRRNES